MLLDNKEIDNLTLEDINALKENSISEGTRLDYKLTIAGNTDSDKKEFLADIISFANTSGGYIVYGIEEKKGVPINISGLKTKDIDAVKLRLHSIIQNGIEPKINNIRIHSISVGEEQFILIIKIPKSWSSPHIIWFQQSGKIFARNSAGKYQLDVNQMKEKFLQTETINNLANKFRKERVNLLESGEGIIFDNDAKLMFHIIPVEAFSQNKAIDFTIIKSDTTNFQTLNEQIQGWNYNLDGIYVFASIPGKGIDEYSLFFHNGILEAVADTNIWGEEKKISIFHIEDILIKSTTKYFQILKNFDLNYPYVLCLSLINVKEYTVDERNSVFQGRQIRKIDRDIVLIPEMVIDDPSKSTEQILKPIFDRLWNACGFSKSFSYDDNGLRKKN